MNNKDFLEKYIKFSHNGKHYIYFSFIPDEALKRDSPAKTDRSFSVFGV